jgi:hypothetical protein
MPPIRFQGQHTINAAGQTIIDPTSPVVMDGNITIGCLSVPMNNSYILTNAVLTENAPGDVSINVAASQNAVIGMCASEYFKQSNDLLSTTSVPALNASGLLADDSGDAPILKGSKITGFELAYSVQGGPLTSFVVRADINTFEQATVNVITSMVASGQNGLVLANTANATTCNVTTVPIAAPFFDTNDNTQMFIRLNPVTPGGCTFRLYSLSLLITFNYN